MCSSAYAMIMHSLENLAETVLRKKKKILESLL